MSFLVGSRIDRIPGRWAPSVLLPAVSERVQVGLGAALAVAYLACLGLGIEQAALGVVVLTAAISLVLPATGLAMFVSIMSMREPEVLVPLRFNAVMAGSIALGCLIRLPIERPSLRIPPAFILLIGYLVISALSILPMLSGHPSSWTPSALSTFTRLTVGVTLLLSAGYVFRSMSPWPFLGLAVAGATATALLAIGELIGLAPLPGLLEQFDSLRASGTFGDPNFFGMYLATASIFAIGIHALVPRRWRMILWPVIAILLIGLFLTYSRGAYIGFFAGLIILVFLRDRLAGVALAIALLVAAAVLYPAFIEARQGGMLTPLESFDMAQSEGSRANLAAAGFAMFLAFPVFGVGYGVFQYVSPDFIVGATDSTFSHNMYLNILAEQGLIGFLLVATMLVWLTITLVRSSNPLRNAVLAVGATFLAASMFLHSATVFQSSGLILLAIAAALAPGMSRTPHALEA
jgi:O-antigen ligase